MKTYDLFRTHSVFSLGEAREALTPRGGQMETVERLKYHLESERLKHVSRGVYAVVPAGVAVAQFRPDPFLVAAAARLDGIFSYHSALELLGVAHTVWSHCTLYVARRRRPIVLDDATIRFLDHPGPLSTKSLRHTGTRRVERQGRILETTGPERTLVEGFRRPALAGGLEELVSSAGAFPVLDLDLLMEILRRYGIANLWAATGWFLERFQKDFHVPPEFLARLESHRPHSPQYLDRGRRGGKLVSRWNLILPDVLLRPGEADES